MAGAGQPWYMPVLWPVAHVTTALTKPKDDKPRQYIKGYYQVFGWSKHVRPNLTAKAL